MSSPRGAALKAARARPAAAAEKAPAKIAKVAKIAKIANPAGGAAAEAQRLAAEIERAVAQGKLDVLTPDAAQALMAALCRLYSARVESGQELLPLPSRGVANATDVMITASGLLKSANLAVFELGMWQSWTGR
jgi:hypothetical protein